MRAELVAIAFISAAIVLGGCYGKEVAVEESALGLVEISGSSADRFIDVRLREGVSEEDVMDPGLFADFLPPITHAEAVEKFGEPFFIRRTGVGTLFYYETSKGVVEVAREKTRSWGSVTTWELRAYPNDQDASRLLNPEIAKYLRASDEYLSLTVLNPNGTPGRVIVAKNGEVLYVIWVNQRGIAVESAREAPIVSRGVD